MRKVYEPKKGQVREKSQPRCEIEAPSQHGRSVRSNQVTRHARRMVRDSDGLRKGLNAEVRYAKKAYRKAWNQKLEIFSGLSCQEAITLGQNLVGPDPVIVGIQ